MLAPSQWKTSLHSNAVSHWLGANLESTLQYIWQAIFHQKSKYQPDKSISTFSSYYRSAIGKTLLNVLNVLNWHPVIWSIYCKPLENRHPMKICWHDDVIKWKHFPRYWPFVRRIHRSTVNSLHKGQWRGAMMFSLICDWKKGWVNNHEAGDLRLHRAHYDVIVMALNFQGASQHSW